MQNTTTTTLTTISIVGLNEVHAGALAYSAFEHMVNGHFRDFDEIELRYYNAAIDRVQSRFIQVDQIPLGDYQWARNWARRYRECAC